VSARPRRSLLRRWGAATAAVGVVLVAPPAGLAGGVAPDPSPQAKGAIAPDPPPAGRRITPARSTSVAPEAPSTSSQTTIRNSSARVAVAGAHALSPAPSTRARPKAKPAPKRADRTATTRAVTHAAPASPPRHDEWFADRSSPSKDTRTLLLAGLALLAFVAASLSLIGAARRVGVS